MAGPVINRQSPQTGQKWLDELLLGLELPSPAGMAGVGGKAAARASIAELVDLIRSGKIADMDLVPKALSAIKGAGKVKGVQNVARGAQPLASAGTLQASLGKFSNPQALQNAIGKTNVLGKLAKNKPLQYSAMAGGLGSLVGMKFPGDSGEEEAYDPGLEWAQVDTDSLWPAPSARKSAGRRSVRKPSLSQLAPPTVAGLPENLGPSIDSTPEALEFLQGRNLTEGNPFYEGQTSSQALLGDTSGQRLPEKKKNNNLLLSLLKGLW